MEDLPYESVVAILSFWAVLIIGFIIIICRMKASRANDTSDPSTSSITPASKRIIQIYYIGNWDSNSIPTSNTDDILSKVLSRIDDPPPPSYEEVSVNVVSSTNDPPNDELSRTTTPQASSSAQIPSHTISRHGNDVLVVVDSSNQVDNGS